MLSDLVVHISTRSFDELLTAGGLVSFFTLAAVTVMYICYKDHQR